MVNILIDLLFEAVSSRDAPVYKRPGVNIPDRYRIRFGNGPVYKKGTSH
jgi:hypothetical protein